jgi:hypothetical protein
MSGSTRIPEPQIGEAVGMHMFRSALKFSEWRDCATTFGRERMIDI